jgi:hypothetical protein
MYFKILIIICLIAVGFILKKVGIFNRGVGEALLTKVLFYVILPAAIFLNISQIPLSTELFFLPISCWGISLICFSVAFLYAKWAKLGNKTKGTLFAGTTMINLQMVAYPFLKFVYGEEAFGRLLIFEFGGYILAFTFVYFLAIYYGNPKTERKGERIKQSLIRLIKVPPIWALFLGIAVNLGRISLPVFLKDLLGLASSGMVPLLLLSLGIYFEPSLNKIKHLAAAIFIRIGIGFAAGLLMVNLFQLEGLSRTVVLIVSIMPAGYNALVFSAKEKLDEEFAASLVAISVIVSLAIIPILTFFLG